MLLNASLSVSDMIKKLPCDAKIFRWNTDISDMDTFLRELNYHSSFLEVLFKFITISIAVIYKHGSNNSMGPFI